MKQLLAIGEALIDFAPEETGKELKDVSAFKPKVGGAPAKSFRTAASDATMSAEPIKRILLWHSWH